VAGLKSAAQSIQVSNLGGVSFLWASNGFDIKQNETNASSGCLVGHFKTTEAQQNAKTQIRSNGMTVAEADAILMATGYVEKTELVTV
jgi:hypothetical protein